jgi:hypothetical protein
MTQATNAHPSRQPPGPHSIVDHAITSRHSIRAFLPTPVERAVIEEILAVATGPEVVALQAAQDRRQALRRGEL